MWESGRVTSSARDGACEGVFCALIHVEAWGVVGVDRCMDSGVQRAAWVVAVLFPGDLLSVCGWRGGVGGQGMSQPR